MTWLIDSNAEVVARLVSAGLRVVDDPRNVTPPCALVNPPAFDLMANGVVMTRTTVTLIAPGPGNADAARVLMSMADQAIGVNNVVSGLPSSTIIGAAEYPSYDLTIEIALKED